MIGFAHCFGHTSFAHIHARLMFFKQFFWFVLSEILPNFCCGVRQNFFLIWEGNGGTAKFCYNNNYCCVCRFAWCFELKRKH